MIRRAVNGSLSEQDIAERSRFVSALRCANILHGFASRALLGAITLFLQQISPDHILRQHHRLAICAGNIAAARSLQ
jgi:hypothetical protein